jgi:hypothetical protein
MTDEDYKDMVIEHDKHIDRLTQSVEHLIDSVSSTHEKLNKLLDALSEQAKIEEQVKGLGREIDSLAQTHNKGCPVFSKNIGELKNQLEVSEAKIGTVTSIGKWIGVFLVTYSISFAIYVEGELNNLHHLATQKIHMQRGINTSVERRLVRFGRLLEKFVVPIGSMPTSGSRKNTTIIEQNNGLPNVDGYTNDE